MVERSRVPIRVDDLAQSDWLAILPARSLAHHVPVSAQRRKLLELPSRVTIAQLCSEGSGTLGLVSPSSAPDVSDPAVWRAVKYFRRCVSTRQLSVIRPPDVGWVIPDSVGVALEGRSPSVERRRDTLIENIDRLADNPRLDVAVRRGARRVSAVAGEIDGFPTWLYWYSARTVHAVRRASPDSLHDLNDAARCAIEELGAPTSISTWEERLGIVGRRLPLGVVTPHSNSRRSNALLNRLEKLGIRSFGGLTVISTDSIHFLRQVEMRTLQALSGAFRGALRQR